MSNKSGVAEQVISLAKGGGEMKGLGETFSPDLHTGTGNFSVPIALPPGRNGLQPQLGIAYSTGNGNGCFGLGWQLSIPGVSRKTAKGIPQYLDGLWPDHQDTFLLSSTEDLVPVERQDNWIRYQARTEGLFALIRRYKDDEVDYWEVKSKDGLISYYGQTPFDHNNTVASIYDPDNRNQIFSWHLRETRDPFGNRVLYEYEQDLVMAEDRHWNQLYLKRIKYVDYPNANGEEQFLVSVELEYEEERPDPFSVFTAGFEIRTRKRCTRIATYTHPTPDQSILVKTYSFHYATAAWSKTSLLQEIQVAGHDGTSTERLPPLTFEYTSFEPKAQAFRPISGDDLPNQSLAEADTELVDLFANGLPDIVQMNGVARYWKNKGGGVFASPKLMNKVPAGLSLSDPGLQFADADGEGKVDLLVQKAELSGYFPTSSDGQWDRTSFQQHQRSPSFSFQDPEVKLLDLDGDGITDVLRTGSRLEAYFHDPAKGWKQQIITSRKQLEDFPDIYFSDPRVRLADMTGDGLQDILFIHGRYITYWPNRGYNRWGKRIQMANAPQLPKDYDPKRLLIGDIAGDGPHDFIYIDFDEITIWINQNGNGFSPPITIGGTPPVTDQDTVRLVDLYGTGTSGILWSAEERTPGRDHYFFLDLTHQIKPFVLREMNNHMGAITKVAYRPSTYYYLLDEQQADTRWRTTLPFPVQVVARVEVIDQISKNKLVTEYHYRHGYWDGAEREFRGFGRVEQMDTLSFQAYQNEGLQGNQAFRRVEEKFYSPPTKTITWFHQGPVGPGTGDWYIPDYSKEYWQGDTSLLASFSNLDHFLQQLPSRRQRRDALRTLRGSVLRSELYSLDDRSGIPWTVSESLYEIRKEGESLVDLKGMSRAIFFPMAVAQRSTNWERGQDPMTKFSFTSAFDRYGQALQNIQIACPRGWGQLEDEFPEEEPFLSTFSISEMAYSNAEIPYMKDRSTKATNYEIVHLGRASLLDIKTAVGKPEQLKLIAQSITYYDGPAFTGLPYGQIGQYGAAIRTENLVIDTDILTAIWEDQPEAIPTYFQETPSWNLDYPMGFQNSLPIRAGYQYYDGGDHHAEGYWTSSSVEFDFQEAAVTSPKGLVLVEQDTLGRRSQIEYDHYRLLPIQVTDPIGLSITAGNDYRLLQPYVSKDPNDNVVQVRFSPLGFVKENYLLGKEGKEEGDGLDRNDTAATPSSSFHYDWLAWVERKAPISVTSIAREYHHYEKKVAPTRKNDTITTVQFSDGFGRIIQSRTQAEDVLFGDFYLGNELLPEQQGGAADSMKQMGRLRDATEPINVVVSGWQIYDNKGQVVQQYEPFYAAGFAYADLADQLIGQRVEQFYDPLGRVIKSCFPDGSEQSVVFGIPKQLHRPEDYLPSPWEVYTYDPNDNAERSGHGDQVDESHWNTPASTEVDALGRTIKAVARNREKQPDGSWSPIQEYTTYSNYDIRGNLLTVTDALGRLAFQYFYDLTFDEEEGAQLWRTDSIDAGRNMTIYNAVGMEMESRDGKGARNLSAYDPLDRPIKVWARDHGDQSMSMRQRLIYGDEDWQSLHQDELANRIRQNQLGTLWQQYDEAGLINTSSFDFKGNPLSTERQVIATEALLPSMGQIKFSLFQVDWERDAAAALLEQDIHAISIHYDALNRPQQILYPTDKSGKRQSVSPTYNRAGALKSIVMEDTEVGVQHIAYNARGQRTLIAYKNGVMTRYAYDDQRFWLKRLRTELFAQPPDAPFEFVPNGGLKQDIGYEYDLVGNITKIKERGSNLGIPATQWGKDALDRDFSYDPLYRLIDATGRERDTNRIDPQHPWLQELRPTHAVSVTNPTTRFYQRRYQYDPVGNLLHLKHTALANPGQGNFSRLFNTDPRNNRLRNYEQADQIHTLRYDVCGNLVKEANTRHYHWNHADQLHGFRIQAHEEAAPSLEARYLYDASGERVKKIVWYQGGKVRTTTYIGGLFEQHTEGQASQPYEKSNNTLHLMDDQSRIALIRVGNPLDTQDNSPTVQYQLADHLGNVQVVLNERGQTHSREEHYPYGGSSLNSFAQKRYRFTGKERDEESGLHYHSARYYAPWMGKWVSADPLGVDAGINSYTYSMNDPINLIDPDGLEDEIPKKGKGAGWLRRLANSNNGKILASIINLSGGDANFIDFASDRDIELSPQQDANDKADKRSKPQKDLASDEPPKKKEVPVNEKKKRREERRRNKGKANPVNSKVNARAKQSKEDKKKAGSRKKNRRSRTRSASKSKTGPTPKRTSLTSKPGGWLRNGAKTVGKSVLAPVGVVFTGYTIWSSENKLEATAEELGTLGAMAAGAKIGASLGSGAAPGPGTVVGAAVGALVVPGGKHTYSTGKSNAEKLGHSEYKKEIGVMCVVSMFAYSITCHSKL